MFSQRTRLYLSFGVSERDQFSEQGGHSVAMGGAPVAVIRLVLLNAQNMRASAALAQEPPAPRCRDLYSYKECREAAGCV